MNGFLESLSMWLVDFYALATVLLAISLLARAFVRQPSARVTLAWGTWLGIALIAVVAALPVWPRYAMDDIAYAWQPPAEAANLQQPEANLLPVEPLVDIAMTETPLHASDLLPTHAEAVTPAIETTLRPPLRQLAAGLWLAAAALGSGWILIGLARTRGLLARAAKTPAWVGAELLRIVGARRLPGLWASTHVSSAVVLGAIRPQIILPSDSLCETNRPAIRAALAHEWAHIRHGDLWLLAIERSLLPLLAVHPLFWWLRRVVRLDQELLADAAAAGEERVEYAEALLAWAQSARPARHGLAAIGMWENPNTLSRRVAMILDSKRPLCVHVNRAWAVALALLLAPVVIGLSLVTLRPASAQDETAESAPTQPLPDEPAPRYQEVPDPVPRAAPPAPWATTMVPVTKIQIDMVILSVNREKLAKAKTSLEDYLQDSPRINCQREAGVVVSDDIRPDDVLKLIKWLKEHDAVKIQSRPSVITLDGHEVSFHVGGEAPILRVEETINGKHERRIEYQQFGTMLTVRPKIIDKDRNRVALDFTAEQANLLPPGEKTEPGAVARDVPGLVSHKFTLHIDKVALGGSLLVAESPRRNAATAAGAKEQFVAVITLHEVIQTSAPAYSDPAAGERGEAKRKATQAALDAATAAEPEPGTAAAALLKAERLARQKETAELKQQLNALQRELAEFRNQNAEGKAAEAVSATSPRQRAEVQLLELDMAEAKLAIVEAEEELNRVQQLRASNAVTQSEVRQRQLAVERVKIQLQRVQIKLEAAHALRQQQGR